MQWVAVDRSTAPIFQELLPISPVLSQIKLSVLYVEKPEYFRW